MPSASAKIEKVASFEAVDPVKQIAQMLEKRVRNLEKRKMKLDNYRADVANGKELNEDQKIAVSKYDEVVSLLDFTKELIKGLNSIVIESTRQQKKLAKKEQLERQQHEIQRLQEAFFYRHMLAQFQNEEARSDFLNGENGAVQLTSEQLSQLDQFYKLIGPGLPNEQADLNNYCHTLAENHIFLVEGRNKEIAGTTYKALKEILQSINECGYFSRPSEPVDDDESSSDETPIEEAAIEKEELKQEEFQGEDDSENLPDSCNEQFETSDEEKIPMLSVAIQEDSHHEILSNAPTKPLQEVLSPQGTFNFLQESQIDLDAPHMDPAVVAVRQIAPPPTVNFNYPPSPPCEDAGTVLVNGSEPHELPPTSPSQVPVIPVRTVPAPILSQSEFDPSHPIPTQTFTNQSFAVMQNMMIPPAYVPVTLHHTVPIPPHIAPIAVVPGLSPPATTASVMPLHVPISTTPDDEGVDQKVSDNEENQLSAVEENDRTDDNTNGVAHEKTNGTNGFIPNYRGGYRGRGRGRGTGYFRGRPNYNNNRGGYQNYYQDRNGYNPNYRRGGNNRGPRPNGNNRGRGNYNNRTQGSQQQQQQQQQTQQ
ncbi:caprin-1-like [Uloborus diversus]|uniref:caprin-1-like n=1 Tax=Uloborus diversus TaxID=327109 RepID=UPI0024096D60|nr:caprin-1-like [Uloborus diversus]